MPPSWTLRNTCEEIKLLLLFNILLVFRQRGREGETEGEKLPCERETSTHCFWYAPDWG